MKNSLIIAAVAATIAGAATADVSIGGKHETTFKSNLSSTGSNSFETKTDMTIKGKKGASTAVIGLRHEQTDSASSAAITVTDAYVSTKVYGLNTTVGKKSGQKGTGLTHEKASSSKATIAGSMGSVDVSVALPLAGGMKISASTKLGGVSVKVQDATADTRHFSATGAMGDNATFAADYSTTVKGFKASTDMSGLNVTFAHVEGVSTQTKGTLNDISGAEKATGLVLSTATGFGKVTGSYVQMTATGATLSTATKKASLNSGAMTYTVSQKDAGDVKASAKVAFSF